MPLRTTDELPTPCLLLDEAVLRHNLDRMSRKALEAGVQLRPHCKTAKSAEVARRATAQHSGAITVSTLNEAAYFIRHGFTDITLAVGIVPRKLERVAELQHETGARIAVLLDSMQMAIHVAQRAAAFAAPIAVFIEIDADLHRTGVEAESPELLSLARVLHEADNVSLQGVLAFGGIGYQSDTPAGIVVAAETERTLAVRAAERLRRADIPCPVVSIGSTPNMTLGESLEGVTEIRPGVYVFMDLMQETLGVCGYDDIAVTVLATVIGHSPSRQRIYVDAGALALSKDHGIARADRLHAPYGLLRDFEGPRPYQDIGVTDVNQEHGFVSRTQRDEPFPFEQFPIGSRVRILPNHVCHTVGSFDRYHVLDAHGAVTDEWERTLGW